MLIMSHTLMTVVWNITREVANSVKMRCPETMRGMSLYAIQTGMAMPMCVKEAAVDVLEVLHVEWI